MEIGENWTMFERTELINRLRREQHQLQLAYSPNADTPSRTAAILYRIADLDERIGFVEMMPASFLEANREAILHGKNRTEDGRIVDGPIR